MLSVNQEKNLGNPCSCRAGDPINVATGNEYREDLDIALGGLRFSRYYNSQLAVADGHVGSHWHHSFDRSLVYTHDTTHNLVTAFRGDGQQVVFNFISGAWKSDADITDRLAQNLNSDLSVAGWSYFDAATRNTEVYDAAGNLISIRDVAGQVTVLAYSDASTPSIIAPKPGLLLSATDSRGRSISFTYNSLSNIASASDSLGNVFSYGYDANGNLTEITYPDGSSHQYVYNEASLTSGGNFANALTGEVDESGVRLTDIGYDSLGRATMSRLAGGADLTQVTYQTDGSRSVTYPSGAQITLSFLVPNGTAHISSASAPCGILCGISNAASVFDGNGYPKSTTDFKGNVTSFQYDATGLLDQEIDAQGQAEQRTINFTWNSALRVPLARSVLNAQGSSVAFASWTYNSNGQVTASCSADTTVSGATAYICGGSINAPAGVRQTRYSYCTSVDANQCPLPGLLLSVDGPRTDVSDITTYTYYLSTDESGCGVAGGACHRAGDLYQITDADGHIVTLMAYDKNGRLVRSQDSNGVITDLTYTPRGWLHTSSVASAVTTIDYNPTGTVSKITDPDGVYISYTYDAAHRLTDITDALGNHIHYTLDAAGNKIKEDTYDSSNTLHRTLSRTYNTLGQLTAITDGLSHTVFNAGFSDSYDANGNLVHTADALGIQRKQGYDALNRLVSTLDNYNGTDTATQNTQATYAYDALDNVEGITDPDGLSTTYDYDGLSNPKALHSPDTGTAQYQVDAAGNRVQQTDAKGIVRNTTYDALNRPVTVSYPDSTQNITYHYDEADSMTGCSGSYPIGRLTRIEEVAVTTTYCYDVRGNVVLKKQVQGSQVDTVAYTYTSANRLSSITAPSGTVTQYSRDAAGRISGVAVTPASGAGQTVVSAISYLPFGPISGYTLGNGQGITRIYDGNYQLTDLTSPVLNLHFSRDAVGNITGLSNTAGGSPVETYSYDPLYRLMALNDASGNAVEAYTYSNAGDRLSKTEASGLASGTYGYQDGTHWLTSIGNAARSYDLNGNTIGAAGAGEALGFGYNDRNRLTLVQRDQQTVANYVYNARNERIEKSSSYPQVVIERYVYNEQRQILGERGTTNRDYIWLGGLPVATVDGAAVSKFSYVYADGVGTPRAITDVAGTVVWQWAYSRDPFGEQAPTGTYNYNLRFSGQYFDQETGLNYNIYRNYDPTTGRYLGSDPLGLRAGPSTYGYVSSNPINGVDPLGLESPRTFCGVANAGPWTGCAPQPPHCADPCGCKPSSFVGLLATIAATEIVGGGPEDPVADGLVAEEVADYEGMTLYRGVASDSPAYEDALEGAAEARGGPANALDHSLGDTNSPYTSWTSDYNVATRFATNNGTSDGVILTKTFAPGEAAQVAPNVEQMMEESEYLVPGRVTGASTVKVPFQ